MFFKDIEDFRKYVGVNAGMEFDQIVPHLNEVDRTIIKPLIGADQLDDLNEHFQDATTFDDLEDGSYKSVINILRTATANLGLAKWLPIGQVMIDGSGVGISSSANRKTAFHWQIKQVEEASYTAGYDALDEALRFMVNNIGDFGLYQASDEYRERVTMFVPSAKEFTKYFRQLNNSMINFTKLLSIMRKVEDTDIKSVLLDDLFDELKEKLEEGTGLSAPETALIEKIKPAVVNLTISRSINELAARLTPQGYLVFDNTGSTDTIDKFKNAGIEDLRRMSNHLKKDGDVYLGILKSWLETNKAEFPAYTNDAGYEAPEDISNVNNGDLNFFVG